MDFLPALNAVVLFLVFVTTVAYLYQIVYLFVPLFFKKKEHHTPQKKHRYGILIAARNEEAVLPHLLDTIRQQDYPADLLTTFVVADNCTDNTARIAAERGAIVYPRFNKKQVGKGYALNYLLSQIEADGGLDRFDAFLVFDADNLLRSNYITEINRLCDEGFEAFCGYRNSKNFGDSWVSSGHALWYLHESTHLNRSRMIVGTTCAVSGTGFGFTTELLNRCGGWRYFTLTEDLEFNAWCATHGVRIGYCHDAILYDEQPSTLRQSWRQRTRWTQGGLQVSFRYAKDLLKGIFTGGMTTYASFETATLSLWGYGMATLSYGLTLLITFLTERWLGLAQAMALSFVGSYVTMALLGAYTLWTEWDRIKATKQQKLRSIFTFPFYMITTLPISVSAMFRKFGWPPIEHKVAISAKELATPNGKK